MITKQQATIMVGCLINGSNYSNEQEICARLISWLDIFGGVLPEDWKFKDTDDFSCSLELENLINDHLPEGYHASFCDGDFLLQENNEIDDCEN